MKVRGEILASLVKLWELKQLRDYRLFHLFFECSSLSNLFVYSQIDPTTGIVAGKVRELHVKAKGKTATVFKGDEKVSEVKLEDYIAKDAKKYHDTLSIYNNCLLHLREPLPTFIRGQKENGKYRFIKLYDVERNIKFFEFRGYVDPDITILRWKNQADVRKAKLFFVGSSDYERWKLYLFDTKTCVLTELEEALKYSMDFYEKLGVAALFCDRKVEVFIISDKIHKVIFRLPHSFSHETAYPTVKIRKFKNNYFILLNICPYGNGDRIIAVVMSKNGKILEYYEFRKRSYIKLLS